MTLLRGGKNQLEFAKLLNFPADRGDKSKQAMVSRYESGETPPPPEVLLLLSEIFGRSVNWILTGEEEPAWFIAESRPAYGLPEEEQALLDLYRGADPICREDAVFLLKRHQTKPQKKAGA